MSSNNNNSINVPEARDAMNKFKMEPEAGLQRRPYFTSGRFSRRSDGEKDDRGLRKEYVISITSGHNYHRQWLKKAPPVRSGRSYGS